MTSFRRWPHLKYHTRYFHSLMTRAFWRQNIQNTSLEVLRPFYILDPILKSDSPPLYIRDPVLWSDQPIISCIKASVLVLIKHLRTWLRCVNIIYNIKVTTLMFQICLPFQWCPLWRAIIKNMWNCIFTLNDLNFIYKLVSSTSSNNWQI